MKFKVVYKGFFLKIKKKKKKRWDIIQGKQQLKFERNLVGR